MKKVLHLGQFQADGCTEKWQTGKYISVVRLLRKMQNVLFHKKYDNNQVLFSYKYLLLLL